MLIDVDRHNEQATRLVIDGKPLSMAAYSKAIRNPSLILISDEAEVASKVGIASELVAAAVRAGRSVYGVTTGFGGMADESVPDVLASESQKNLLSFLAAGAGQAIDPMHVQGAMLLRANVLLRGCSGIRMELVERLVHFLRLDATPVVRELGSIGASGDLVPLATIARAITGQSNFVKVLIGGQLFRGAAALQRVGLKPIELRPKEGLALVNGTSFSAAIAANATSESKTLMSLALGVQSMMLRALQVQESPFSEFVQQCKPHPGQVWSAQIMRRLLTEGCQKLNGTPKQVQDRYSLRCLPQYMAPITEGIARIQRTVETEMNAVSDNPLIDTESGRFYEGGNFLGQYIGVAMDDLRRFLGLLAKHLDVQIATLVAPEFSCGLSSSLRGNEALPYNMGLKGLQIAGNSIMPMLTHSGNPLVEHFPTHAEQFNQNINGLSWGAANLAWKSVGLFQQYMAISLVFAVQALDLRAKLLYGHYDGRAVLGDLNQPIYEAVLDVLNAVPGHSKPFLFDDGDRWLEEDIAALAKDIREQGLLVTAIAPVLASFGDEFGLEA